MEKHIPDDLRKGLKWSAIGHLILMMVILIQSFLLNRWFKQWPAESSRYTPTLRVDLVGLPDVLKKDLPKISREISKSPQEPHAQPVSPKTPPVEVPRPGEMGVKSETKYQTNNVANNLANNPTNKLKPSTDHSDHSAGKALENRNKNALKRLKALAKLQDFSESTESKNPKRLETDSQISKLNTQVKGNRLSPGTSLSGEAKEALQSSYLDLLRDHLNENFKLTPWLERQKTLTAKIQIFLDARGSLRNYTFVKPSGNSQFDDAVKRAVQESQPYPYPPKELESLVLNRGIILGFPL